MNQLTASAVLQILGFVFILLVISFAIWYQHNVRKPLKDEKALKREEEERLEAIDELLNAALSEAGGYYHK